MTDHTVRSCPSCQSPAHVRTSRKMSAIAMERRVYCSNPACGRRWIELWEACEILLPKSRPDPYEQAAALFPQAPPCSPHPAPSQLEAVR